MKKIIYLVLSFIVMLFFGLTGCEKPQEKIPTPKVTPTPEVTTTPEKGHLGHIKGSYDCVTIAKAVELANASSQDPIYLYGIVSDMYNTTYGNFHIKDESGNDITIYGLYDEAGKRYDAMESKPVDGDEVVVYGTLSLYNGKPQIANAVLKEFYHEVPVIEDNYQEMTVLAARGSQVGTCAKITGVVSRITYANGYIPDGFYVSDGTASIYVYGKTAATQVAIGDNVTVAGKHAYFISEDEAANAAKYDYKGSSQLEEPTIIVNSHNNTVDYSFAEETTIKALLSNKGDVDFTNKYYKVTGYIKKVVSTGFTNYYLNDIDDATGSYVYTKCNGGDYTWLDQYDGKLCSFYMVVINAKSTASGLAWRLVPISVIGETTFDATTSAEMVAEYVGLKQFTVNEYSADPELVLATQYSNEKLNINGATLTYTSSNQDAVYFEANSLNQMVMHTKDDGAAVITIEATVGSLKATRTITITVKSSTIPDSITIAEAIEKEVNEEVTVRGIIASGIANKVGFYLVDSTGVIAVTTDADTLATLAIGNEVVVKGKRDLFGKYGSGVICITNATLEANLYGTNDYNTSNIVNNVTLSDLYDADVTDYSFSVTMYHVTGKFTVVKEKYSSKAGVTFTYKDGTEKTLSAYCSGAGQYSCYDDLKDQELEMDIIMCDWNGKTYYSCCIMAIYKTDGTRIVLPL